MTYLKDKPELRSSFFFLEQQIVKYILTRFFLLLLLLISIRLFDGRVLNRCTLQLFIIISIETCNYYYYYY